MDSFSFSPDEYLEFRERLEQAIRRHRRLAPVSEALQDLNTGFFRHQTLEECTSFITEHLEVFLDRAKKLKLQYLVAINSHARKSIFGQRRRLSQRTQALRALTQQVAAITEGGGRPSRKKQQALKMAWSNYRKTWLGEETDVVLLPDAEAIQHEQEQLDKLRDAAMRELASANLALSTLTVDPTLGDASQLSALGDALVQLVQDIDESGLYQLPLGGAEAATTTRQLQRLEGILQRLSNSYQHLGELPDFYARRHFWYAQPARLRRLLAPLQDVPTTAWGTAFASWYFDRCLEQFLDPQTQEVNCAALVARLEEAPELSTQPPELAGLVFLEPGQPVPAEAAFVVDFTGGDPPPDFQGTYLSQRPLTDRAARHHAIADVVDPKLVLQQSFVPLSPPAWQAVRVSQPPPNTEGALCVQLAEGQDWCPLTSWDGTPTEHLRVYLPENFNAEAGALFLDRFEWLLNNTVQLTVFHNWSTASITQELLSDGLNPGFLMAALLRAAEACSEVPYDESSLLSIGQEIRLRCGVKDPEVHPLAEHVRERLQELLPDYFFTLHQPWRDTFLPLVVLSPSGKKTVLLPSGRLPGQTDLTTEALRQQALNTAGLSCLEINAYACWEDVDTEVERLVAALAD